MSRNHRFACGLLLLLVTGIPAGAQQSGLPLQPTRPLQFTTDEGTWLSLDVSPDGQTIVFELLGDLYTLPIAGGKATRITSGIAFDAQPRYSPDGRSIAFISDRSGSENVWIANADGNGPRQLTSQTGTTAMVSPEWTPDGRGVMVTRRATGGFGAAELVLFAIAGGSGIPVTMGPSITGVYAPVGAAFGKDQRYLWFAVRLGPLTNLYAQQWQLAQHDLGAGETHIRASGRGSAMRPTLSPDGRWLVYGTRRGPKTQLLLRNLVNGDESTLVDDGQRDEGWSVWTRDILPGSSFTPDSKALITSHHGKIWRVDVPSGRAVQIPFSADVDQKLGALAHFSSRVDDGAVLAKQIRSPQLSPDGSRLAFSALDRLWVVSLPGGTPKRVTDDSIGEHSPAWSPDGRYLAYVTWDDGEGGHVNRVAMADGCPPRCDPQRLTEAPAFYDRLAYSPDGRRLVAVQGSRQPRMQQDAEPSRPGDYTLVWLPSTGGAASMIAPIPVIGTPHFGPDSSRVYVFLPSEGLVSMRLDGLDRRVVLNASGQSRAQAQKRPDEVILSPRGGKALVQWAGQVYLVDVPEGLGSTVTVSMSAPTTSVPVRRLTQFGGEFPAWSRDGQTYTYSLGRFWYRGDASANERGLHQTPANGVELKILVPRDRPSGTIVLSGARLITMKGTEIIESGDIVITDDRIVAIGRKGRLKIPDGARVMDMSTKTIIPGWIDIHAHMGSSRGVHHTQVWQYAAQLAYGVTSTRDPQTTTTDVLVYSDRVETGDLIGPRIFSTAHGMFGEPYVRSLDDARALLLRWSSIYDTRTLKQYAAGNRQVRQWIIMAANEQKLTPTTEAGHDFKENLTVMLDGYAGLEHSLPVAPVFKDVIELAARSGLFYTPTLLINYGGPMAENWFYFRNDIREDAKLRRFTPQSEMDNRGLRQRDWFSDDQYIFRRHGDALAKIVAAGGKVGLGGHGQLQGLGVHWELELLASGGMPLHDVLRAGTIVGAEAIGFAQDLGSLEPDKLADLQVLDQSPLRDIRNTKSIRYVMKGGRLYEANTLNEIWPRQRSLPKQWWQTR